MKKLTTLLILLLLFNVQAFAMSGGGGDNALSLETSTPVDGAVDISLEPEIVLTFSNNVANASVSENNIASIKMVGPDNSLVALNVEVHDDQILPDDKRLIFITPTSPLSPLTQYTIIISPEVTSKNGVQLGKEVKVSFTTLGQAIATTEPETTVEVTTEAVTQPPTTMPTTTQPVTTNPAPTESVSPQQPTTQPPTFIATTIEETTEATSSDTSTAVEETTIIATTVVETTIAESTELTSDAGGTRSNSTVTIIVILGIVALSGIVYMFVQKSKK